MQNKVIQKTTGKSHIQKLDVRFLFGGILFSLIFTFIIWWTGQRLSSIPHLPDQGALWYFWKLPAPTFWGRLTSWGLYFFHQVSFWYLIYYAQNHVNQYTNGIHKVNIIALGINALFIFLHLIQTQIWYDGLGQDTPIWSSQGSVIIMLVWILLMENKRRGLFWGKKLPIKDEIIRWARKYHGYVFAWATIYTFWFHPMEPTSGHLIGFLYMFLLLVQSSLFFTRVHTNRIWTVVLEVTVLLHGTLVAIMQGNGIWPMFAFGFGGIFVITQMHGINLKNWTRWVLLAIYIGLALIVYRQRGWIQLNEVIRIPVIEYLAVILLAGLIGSGLWISRKFFNRQSILPKQNKSL
jgi:hypothetical protein